MNKYYFDLWDREFVAPDDFYPFPSHKKINDTTAVVSANTELDAIKIIDKNCIRQFKKLIKIELQNE